MLGDLRQKFNERLPGGLTDVADTRLQRTLQHYIKEVIRINGNMDEQEILRVTYDSMAGWFRRNTTQLNPAFRKPTPPIIDYAAAPDVVPGGGGLSAVGGSGDALYDGEEDPIVLFERIKAARDSIPPPAGGAGGPTRFPEPVETRTATTPAPAPMRIPELESIETRARVPAGGIQPKDFLQRQENVVKYREVEYNLILNSKDRDWLHSTRENRYNFSIQMDSSTRAHGTGIQATIQNRFRNIVRIEFVKAILPVEGLDVVVPRECKKEEAPNMPDHAFYSALSMPYINVLLDEATGNNFGTDDTTDKSLAVCQYDATWRSDAFNIHKTTNRGYTLFFPKFMKAQRVYQPTPLASLQRLGFQLVGPENQILSKTPDSVAVQSISFGSNITCSCYSDLTGEYLFVQAKEWFPLWSFSQLDRITFAGLTFNSATPAVQAAGASLIRWLEREEGHVVVGIGYSTYPGDAAQPVDVQDGANACGYANWVIIRNRFADPKDGSCALEPFTAGGDDKQLAQELAVYPASHQEGGVLNLSRQVQLVLRIVTRELDSATNVRPDNV